MKAFVFEGEMGKDVKAQDIPEQYLADAKKYRAELIEAAVEHDEVAMNNYLEGKEPTNEELKKLVRKATIANKMFPTFCGTALKNKGVQLVLDGVVDYLPSPLDVPAAKATNPDTGEETERKASDAKPFAALVFKLQADPFVGQLTFFRVYSGTFETGQSLYNASNGKSERVGRMVRSEGGARFLQPQEIRDNRDERRDHDVRRDREDNRRVYVPVKRDEPKRDEPKREEIKRDVHKHVEVKKEEIKRDNVPVNDSPRVDNKRNDDQRSRRRDDAKKSESSERSAARDKRET
jgi:hypothetical protein